MTDRPYDRPTFWLTDLMTDRHYDRPTLWPTDRRTDCPLTDRPSTDQLTERPADRPTDQPTDRLTDRQTISVVELSWTAKKITVLKCTKANNLSRPNKKFLIFWISNSHSSCVEVIHNKMPSSMVLEKWETPMNDDNLRTILWWLMYLISASGGSQVYWGKLESQKTSHRG